MQMFLFCFTVSPITGLKSKKKNERCTQNQRRVALQQMFLTFPFAHFITCLILFFNFPTLNLTLLCFPYPLDLSSAGGLPQVSPGSDSSPGSLPSWHEEGASAGSHRHDSAVWPLRVRGQEAQVREEKNPRYETHHWHSCEHKKDKHSSCTFKYAAAHVSRQKDDELFLSAERALL